MEKEGKYLYCIVQASDARNFGNIGIGGRGDSVATIGYQDLSAVISDTPTDKYVVSRENMTAHQKVVEKAMAFYGTVLPVRFCNVAGSVEEVRSLLRKRYSELKGLLKDMDGKVELGLKAMWKDLNKVFSELVAENPEIKKNRKETKYYEDKIALGEKVKAALDTKRESEADEIINPLRKISHDYRLNKVIGDRMVVNAAFLIEKTREKEFDSLVNNMAAEYGHTLDLKYVGPTPPYNFVEITLSP
ncbi:MAG: GvpL/GvpF family gas vesicle protein [Candidatus Saganbacteria bacterium]|nr:GvpL/GvpF family gas vesicle protein [Candidatus Saganbacteria bacterium]